MAFSAGLDGGHNHSKVGIAHSYHQFHRCPRMHTHIHTCVNLPANPRTGRRSTSDVGGELASHCSREGGGGQTHPSPTSNLKQTQVSIAAERTSSVVFTSLPPATPSSRSEGLDGGHNHRKVGIAHSYHQFYRCPRTHTHIHTCVNLPANPWTGRRSTSDVGGELASHKGLHIFITGKREGILAGTKNRLLPLIINTPIKVHSPKRCAEWNKVCVNEKNS